MDVSLMQPLQTGTRGRADRAAIELVRIVMADDWTPAAAADRLRIHVGSDRAVLQLLRTCVDKVNLERPTPVGERASLTVERTLASGDGTHRSQQWDSGSTDLPARHVPRGH